MTKSSNTKVNERIRQKRLNRKQYRKQYRKKSKVLKNDEQFKLVTQIIITINNIMHDWKDRFSQIIDPRKKKSKYNIAEIVFSAIALFVF